MYNLLLFDLDGTVCNTNNLIINSLRHVLSSVEGIYHPDGYLLKYWGKPLQYQLRNFLPDRNDYENLTVTYRNYYNDHQLEYLSEFPEIRKTLKELTWANKTTGIVTSKLTKFATETLNILNYGQYFKFVIGCDMVENVKPHPEPILKAIKLTGINCNETIYIGDNIDDIIAAKKSNVTSAVVGWSLIDKKLLMNEYPDYLFNSPKEISELLV